MVGLYRTTSVHLAWGIRAFHHRTARGLAALQIRTGYDVAPPKGTTFKVMLAVHLETDSIAVDSLYWPGIAAVAVCIISVLVKLALHLKRWSAGSTHATALRLGLGIPLVAMAAYITFLWTMLLRVSWPRSTVGSDGGVRETFYPPFFLAASTIRW